MNFLCSLHELAICTVRLETFVICKRWLQKNDSEFKVRNLMTSMNSVLMSVLNHLGYGTKLL